MDASSANSCHTCSFDDKDALAKAKQKSYKRSSTSIEYLIEAKKPFAVTSPVIRGVGINNSQPFKNCVSERMDSDIQHIPQESPSTWNVSLPTFLQNPSSANSITEKIRNVSVMPFQYTSKDPHSKQIAFVRRSNNNSTRPGILKINTILPVPKCQAFDSVSAHKKTVSNPDTSMPLKIGSVFSLAYKSKQATTTSEQLLYNSSTALKSSIKIEPSWCSANVKTEPVTLAHSSTDSTSNFTNNPTPVPVMCVPNLNTIMKYRTENTDCDHDPKGSTPASVTAAFKRVIETIGKVPEDVLSDKNECPTILLPSDVQSMQPRSSFSPKLNSVANDLYISERVQQAIRLKWKQTLGIKTLPPEIKESNSSVTLPLWRKESKSPLALSSERTKSNKIGTLSSESHSSLVFPAVRKESHSSLTLSSVKRESNSSFAVSSERNESHSALALSSERRKSHCSFALPSEKKDSNSLALSSEGKELYSSESLPLEKRESNSTWTLSSNRKELISSFASSDIKESKFPWKVPSGKIGLFHTETVTSKDVEPNTLDTLPTKRQGSFPRNMIPSGRKASTVYLTTSTTKTNLPSIKTFSSWKVDSDASLPSISDKDSDKTVLFAFDTNVCKSDATVEPISSSNRNLVLLSKLKEIVSSNIARSENELIAADLENTSQESVSTKDNAIVNALSTNQNGEHFPDVHTVPDYNKSSGNTIHCEFPKHSETFACCALGQDKEIVQRSNIQTLLRTCKSCSVVLEKLPLKNAYFRTKCWKKFLKYKRTKGIRLKRMGNKTKLNKTFTKVNEIIPQTFPMDSSGGELVSTNLDSICFDRSYILKKELQAHTDIIQSVPNERNMPTHKSCNELVPKVRESQGLDETLLLQNDTHLHSLVSQGNPDETMKLLDSSTSQPHESFDIKLPQTQVLPISTNDSVTPTAKDTVAMKCVLFNFQGKSYLAMVPVHDLLKAEDGSTVIKNVGKLFMLKVVKKPTS